MTPLFSKEGKSQGIRVTPPLFLKEGPGEFKKICLAADRQDIDEQYKRPE